MRFEISDRITTRRSQTEVLGKLEEQFRKVSSDVKRTGDVLQVKSIEATFGSINRTDATAVTLRKTEDGYLCVADVNYRPSGAFWIILIITLFTWVFWLLPIAFYLYQQKTVKTAIEGCFKRIKDEVQSGPITNQAGPSSVDDLEKLASLREKGILTEQEFRTQKAKILGTPTEPQSPSPPPLKAQPRQNIDNRTTPCPLCQEPIRVASLKVGENFCPHCNGKIIGE